MQTIIITLNNGKKEEYVKGIKVKEILNKMSKEEREDAILIKYNNKKVDICRILLTNRINAYILCISYAKMQTLT